MKKGIRNRLSVCLLAALLAVLTGCAKEPAPESGGEIAGESVSNAVSETVSDSVSETSAETGISETESEDESEDSISDDRSEPSVPPEMTESSAPSEPSETSDAEASVPGAEESSDGPTGESLHTMTPMEQEIFDLLNAERVKNGGKELTYFYEIYPCALVRAQEAMVLWSHTRPNGKKSSSVYEDCGIPLYGYTVSENLGRNFRSAERIMEAFMNSEGHRANILNPIWDSVCIAVAEDGDGTLYVSQLFTANPGE